MRMTHEVAQLRSDILLKCRPYIKENLDRRSPNRKTAARRRHIHDSHESGRACNQEQGRSGTSRSGLVQKVHVHLAEDKKVG